jgi:hypothetical protein
MKTFFRTLAFALIVVGVSLSAEGASKPSKISVFGGRYSGSVSYGGGGQLYFGTTTGNFFASKKKETGTLSLNSVLAGTLFLGETFAIRNRQLIYTINAGGSGGGGVGTATAGKNRISYSGTFSVGGIPYSLFGTMRVHKRKLVITEIISGNVVLNVNYNLTKSGKK